MKTTPARQMFPKGLAKILLGIDMDTILNFLKRADRQRAFRKCILLPPSGV